MNKQGSFFDGIKVGDEIPSLTQEITQVGMVMYSAATWDFARVHYDKEFVERRGFPAPFVDGQMLGAYLAEMIMNWIGDSGTLNKLNFQFRKMVFPCDRVICKGSVTEKHAENEQRLITCDLWVENQDGEKVLAPAGALISF